MDVDVAMGQIPRSTERISSIFNIIAGEASENKPADLYDPPTLIIPSAAWGGGPGPLLETMMGAMAGLPSPFDPPT